MAMTTTMMMACSVVLAVLAVPSCRCIIPWRRYLGWWRQGGQQHQKDSARSLGHPQRTLHLRLRQEGMVAVGWVR
jgi:hypothetical protein